MVNTVYFGSAFRARKLIVDRMRATIGRLQATGELPQDLSIAFRGMSGAVIAPIVAHELDLGLIVVRKPNDSSHSENRVEGERHKPYVIVDDFVSTGTTVLAIIEAIEDSGMGQSCLGVILYQRPWWKPTFTHEDFESPLPVWFAGQAEGEDSHPDFA